MLKKIIILALLPLAIRAQNTIGLPEINNYTKNLYNAGAQNWDIRQDKQGVIYVANNEGLLTFDGQTWQLYPLPNKTIVRSVLIGEDGKIYVGGQDELGYFLPNSFGKLVFTSLIKTIPEVERNFGDVWDIVSFKKGVYFRTSNKIFRFFNGKTMVFSAPGEFAYLENANDQLLVHDYEKGLLHFDKNKLVSLGETISGSIQLPKTDGVTAILSIGENKALITTLKSGLFLLNQTRLEKINTPNNTLFSNERIYAATIVNNEWVALATTNGGVYIIDHSGNIIKHFSRTEGLQNNNILSIFLDKEKNLWLGLNNGIDFIANNSAIKNISPQLNEESGYTAIVHNNQLYLGTSNGLFSVPLQPAKDISFSKGNFSLVKNTRGQNWSLQQLNGKLLLGHHDGAFEIKGNTAMPFSNYAGFWNFIPYHTGIMAGNYKGLLYIDGPTQTPIPSFKESSRFVAVDGNLNTWVSHPYHGIFKIDSTNKVSTYGTQKGLPSTLNNHVFLIKNKITIATSNGVYQYNKERDLFEQDGFFLNLLGNKSIRYLKEDRAGNIWFIHEKNISVIDLSGDQPQVIDLPELKNKMLSGFEMIYAVDEHNIFLGGERGFYHINYKKYKQNTPQLNVQVRSLKIGSNLDSLVFGGYFNRLDLPAIQLENQIPSIDFDYNSVQIDFAASQHGYLNNIEYSFRLKGLESNWSLWSQRTEKEYTNLSPGKYTFELKARSNLGNESPIAAYSFVILAPWYRTLFAYIIYTLMAIVGVFILYRWQKRKFIQQQLRFQVEQKKLVYIHELERSKTEGELAALRNEKLESDLNFKNTELASSAMHLVKKGELLTKIKTELSQISKKIDNEYAITELKKMIKTLGEDEQLDEEWEYFTKHFDKVHSNFIVSLKAVHPNISNNEIKLCAYLRMNLTTKEIAQLMNISVRGVEISRYRLRKKLNLATEVNLFNYLIAIGNQDTTEQ
ncbi:ligand-binding sensor domain-containing protein [Sediminibacterium sp.]|uniref:ligand-binding sensor domain-containing protein n=1 Tax=Sediminibacterium sp. TaxID=1917865 RepID=UPI003F6F0DF9